MARRTRHISNSIRYNGGLLRRQNKNKKLFMEYKKTIAILMKLQDRRKISAEEKEAVWTAIGVLDWALIAQKSMRNRIKAQKSRLAKSIEL
jgi:hypothetical protein